MSTARARASFRDGLGLGLDASQTSRILREASQYSKGMIVYRQRFRAVKPKPGESSRELVARLDDLAAKWLKSCKTPEEVIVLEQFLNTLPD